MPHVMILPLMPAASFLCGFRPHRPLWPSCTAPQVPGLLRPPTAPPFHRGCRPPDSRGGAGPCGPLPAPSVQRLRTGAPRFFSCRSSRARIVPASQKSRACWASLRFWASTPVRSPSVAGPTHGPSFMLPQIRGEERKASFVHLFPFLVRSFSLVSHPDAAAKQGEVQPRIRPR